MLARDAWRIISADCVLRIVVEEPIDVYTKHQILLRRQLVIHASIEKKLAIVTGVREIAVSRQHKRGQVGRKKCRAILSRVVGGREKERAILDDWTTDGAGVLLECVGNVDWVDRL